MDAEKATMSVEETRVFFSIDDLQQYYGTFIMKIDLEKEPHEEPSPISSFVHCQMCSLLDTEQDTMNVEELDAEQGNVSFPTTDIQKYYGTYTVKVDLENQAHKEVTHTEWSRSARSPSLISSVVHSWMPSSLLDAEQDIMNVEENDVEQRNVSFSTTDIQKYYDAYTVKVDLENQPHEEVTHTEWSRAARPPSPISSVVHSWMPSSLLDAEQDIMNVEELDMEEGKVSFSTTDIEQYYGTFTLEVDLENQPHEEVTYTRWSTTAGPPVILQEMHLD